MIARARSNMTMPRTPDQNRTGIFRLPRAFTLLLLAVAFLLVHVAAPWGISLLSTRYGWVDERPGVWNLLALIVVAAGIAGTFWMIALHYLASPRAFIEWRQGQTLLARGPYAISRNPMYLSELAFWLGWALFYGSLAVLAGFVVFFVLLHFVVVPWEERDLEARFGDSYRAYKVRVPRWLGMSRR